jgi:hypothetical protein
LLELFLHDALEHWHDVSVRNELGLVAAVEHVSDRASVRAFVGESFNPDVELDFARWLHRLLRRQEAAHLDATRSHKAHAAR